jgi:predicted adenine nucleotide alpha hydrolase (AANH) superfamily ATPase
LKLLMHICCSNCSLYPLQILLSRGVDIRGLWFNPNIHPYTEYASRLASVEKLQHLWNLDMEYADEYALDDFLAKVVNKGKDRCYFCYSLRLERAALTARRMGLDGFTTSLLASPYQKFDMIVQIGEETGRRHGIPFHAEDVREGWSVSRGLALELGLYRQKYCGCIYSEMERYLKKVKK